MLIDPVFLAILLRLCVSSQPGEIKNRRDFTATAMKDLRRSLMHFDFG